MTLRGTRITHFLLSGQISSVSHIPNCQDAVVSLAGDVVSPAGDFLTSPNFGICETTRLASVKSHHYLEEICLSESSINI
jgi:hypothetical protein